MMIYNITYMNSIMWIIFSLTIFLRKQMIEITEKRIQEEIFISKYVANQCQS